MNRRRHRVLPALALMSLPLTACAGAPDGQPEPAPDAGTTQEAEARQDPSSTFPVTVDNCGVEVTVAAPPERIVTLNQGATEVALALRLADQMAGTAYLDDEVAERFAEDYAQVPVLSTEYPTVEQFLAAEPDLAIASYSSAFGDNGVGTREELAGRGTATYVSPLTCPDESGLEPTFESVWTELREVGLLTGAADTAEDEVQDQQTAMEEIEATAAGEGLSILWYDSGDDTPLVGAGGGGPQLLMDAVGATNVFADLDGGWADGSWETGLAADPDVIVLADAAWSTAEDKRAYLESDPVLGQLSAVQDERYVVVPFSESTPGVRMVDGARGLSDQLHALNR
ncbi:ABC transporter substrate-binding protein [Ornithinimicrobium pratense]|uniref:ABC transporter substrate-binding protein n=1 Tax=Ornithinimicrobium pratense TaxID=2593973 RepID=A0A5J6V8K1_9MICO|nr:ABC transporter substrate-binding protein [Ornithinimicrobium pratense]QFG69466.1 ABC transporter substrate-binding protein [Ornithinimicrobium pratense]